MTAKDVEHWVTSPYCFCRELPWLVLSGIPMSPAVMSGGWGWRDWAILAAVLIGLAVLLFLLLLLLCLLCPAVGLCCRKLCACCGGKGDKAGSATKHKKGLASAQNLEMSSIGGSDASNLTAVDLKLPRAWMDASKGELTDGGDLGLGGAAFANQKTWLSSNGDASGRFGNRSAETEVHRRQIVTTRGGYEEDSIDGTDYYSARDGYYRNQSAVTIMSPNIGERIREAVHEWQRKNGMLSKKLEETRQSRMEQLEETRQSRLEQREESKVAEFERSKAGQETNLGYSTVQSSSHHESRQQETLQSTSTALVKSSASGSGTVNALSTSGGNGVPIVQCYTVTKKTTTTTYGDEEGDEETAVVTTTEKKWREGMNEVGEISVAASASAGELLPSIGAPAQVLNDTSNVRTVKSLTDVEGVASNVVRRYEFQQQTSNNTETIL